MALAMPKEQQVSAALAAEALTSTKVVWCDLLSRTSRLTYREGARHAVPLFTFRSWSTRCLHKRRFQLRRQMPRWGSASKLVT
jgi:hypothetical protein